MRTTLCLYHIYYSFDLDPTKFDFLPHKYFFLFEKSPYRSKGEAFVHQGCPRSVRQGLDTFPQDTSLTSLIFTRWTFYFHHPLSFNSTSSCFMTLSCNLVSQFYSRVFILTLRPARCALFSNDLVELADEQTESAILGSPLLRLREDFFDFLDLWLDLLERLDLLEPPSSSLNQVHTSVFCSYTDLLTESFFLSFLILQKLTVLQVILNHISENSVKVRHLLICHLHRVRWNILGN